MIFQMVKEMEWNIRGLGEELIYLTSLKVERFWHF